MKRGTKEFYDIQAQFEKGIKAGVFPYLSSDLTKDNSHKRVFYANGEVDCAFKAYMEGYALAQCMLR